MIAKSDKQALVSLNEKQQVLYKKKRNLGYSVRESYNAAINHLLDQRIDKQLDSKSNEIFNTTMKDFYKIFDCSVSTLDKKCTQIVR
jgi:hypothetical protein